MHVHDVMTTPVRIVTPGTTLTEAGDLMPATRSITWW